MLQITDVHIYHKGLDSAVAEAIQLLSLPPHSRCISATGAHGLVEAQKDPAFKSTLQQFYWNLPDGMPLVWLGKAKGFNQMTRCYGPDFFSALLTQTAHLAEVKHFFCGGKEGVAEQLQQRVAIKFYNSNVVGTYCPSFNGMKEQDWQQLAGSISASGATVIWIGLSTPKQERFAIELAKRVSVHLLITVGAAFDFHTGLQPQAPHFMQRAGLEWFFRLCTEPNRLWKRYLEIVPKFVFYGMQDLLRSVLKKNA